MMCECRVSSATTSSTCSRSSATGIPSPLTAGMYFLDGSTSGPTGTHQASRSRPGRELHQTRSGLRIPWDTARPRYRRARRPRRPRSRVVAINPRQIVARRPGSRSHRRDHFPILLVGRVLRVAPVFPGHANPRRQIVKAEQADGVLPAFASGNFRFRPAFSLEAFEQGVRVMRGSTGADAAGYPESTPDPISPVSRRLSQGRERLTAWRPCALQPAV